MRRFATHLCGCGGHILLTPHQLRYRFVGMGLIINSPLRGSIAASERQPHSSEALSLHQKDNLITLRLNRCNKKDNLITLRLYRCTRNAASTLNVAL